MRAARIKVLMLWIGMFTIGAFAGRSYSKMPSASARSNAVQQEHPNRRDRGTSVGMNRVMTVETKPVSISQGKEIVFEIATTGQFSNPASITYAYLLADARGDLVHSQKNAPVALLQARGGSHHENISVPLAGLNDGYYQVRVVAVGDDGTASDVYESSQYFRVDRGLATSVPIEEFYKNVELGKL